MLSTCELSIMARDEKNVDGTYMSHLSQRCRTRGREIHNTTSPMRSATPFPPTGGSRDLLRKSCAKLEQPAPSFLPLKFMLDRLQGMATEETMLGWSSPHPPFCSASLLLPDRWTTHGRRRRRRPQSVPDAGRTVLQICTRQHA